MFVVVRTFILLLNKLAKKQTEECGQTICNASYVPDALILMKVRIGAREGRGLIVLYARA